MNKPADAHHITLEPNPNRVVVTFGGRTIADTTRAIALREGGMPVTQYIPRADADMALLERTTHSSHCPFKGDAAYYSIRADGSTAKNAVWTYEAPFEAVSAIADHLAFYPDRVDGIEERPA